jgi:hypothetical protein
MPETNREKFKLSDLSISLRGLEIGKIRLKAISLRAAKTNPAETCGRRSLCCKAQSELDFCGA